MTLLAAVILLSSWPQFRGPDASGRGDGANLPDAWSAADGRNIAWKTAIPGLAHSSPIVWGDRVFVTTAISSRKDATYSPDPRSRTTATPPSASCRSGWTSRRSPPRGSGLHAMLERHG